MGFGFRKSFGRGPFRFTFSPGGVSTSFGIRGARITKGPRGTFVTVSSHGVYYRHRLDSPRQPLPAPPVSEPELGAQLDSVFHVPLAELFSSTSNELLQRLNANASTTNPAIFVSLLSGGLTLYALAYSSLPSFVAAILIATFAAFVSKRFKDAHTEGVHFSLDDATAAKYKAIRTAISALQSCSAVWVLNTTSSTSDLKRNAGAGTLVTRKTASIGQLSPTPRRSFRTQTVKG